MCWFVNFRWTGWHKIWTWVCYTLDHRSKYSLVCACLCMLVWLYMWVFWHIAMSQSAALLLSSFQETFHKGLRYSPLLALAQKWCSTFVGNSCSLKWLHPLGKKRTHFKDKLEKHWQNRQQTVSMGTEMLISSVLFILFMSFPQKGNNYSFCHCLPFFLVFLCCSVWMFRSFPWVLMVWKKKKILAAFRKVAGLCSVSPYWPTSAFHYLSSF